MKTIILGPPGTGKTTTLLNLVDEFLKDGIRPRQIGYFSFTKKAANEAATRAADKFGLDIENDLPFFRTLHSYAFNQLGMTKEKMMKVEDYKEFGQKCGIPIKTAKFSNEDGTFNSDNEYLTIINTAAVKRMDLLEYYDSRKNILDIERNTLFLLAEELKRFKKEKNLKDFNDLIEDFLLKETMNKFEALFIDEAQDLSLLQWEMVRKIWSRAEKTYIAGDDDQAIFKWAGADVDSFIALQNQMINLPLTQSFRIPAKVHGLAMGIINRIRNRIDKNWQPKTNEGSLHRHFDIDSVDMSTGEWLVLARTRHMLKDVEDSLYRKGFYYENRYKRNYEKDLQEAATDWEYLRKGQPLNFKQLEKISKYMTDKNFSKQKIKGMAKEGMYDMDTLKKHYDLKTSDEWYRAFDDAGQTRVNYLRKMRANGEFLNKKPRIELSTIHAAKGGEAQNVVLLTDLTQTTMNTYERNPDDENRLFYVGATRTKENLHIIEPKKYEKGYLL